MWAGLSKNRAWKEEHSNFTVKKSASPSLNQGIKKLISFTSDISHVDIMCPLRQCGEKSTSPLWYSSPNTYNSHLKMKKPSGRWKLKVFLQNTLSNLWKTRKDWKIDTDQRGQRRLDKMQCGILHGIPEQRKYISQQMMKSEYSMEFNSNVPLLLSYCWPMYYSYLRC